MQQVSQKQHFDVKSAFRMIFLSAIGIFIFFIPINISGVTSIPLDHMVTFLKFLLGSTGVNVYAMVMIAAGAIYPLVTGEWRNSTTSKIFLGLKWLGLAAAILAVTQLGPEALQEPGMLPFLFNKLVVSVGLIVPIGAVFLAFLVSYGLLECIGILVQKLMRPVWKTPGRSAIDAVASFVGSYSIGLLITNRVYVSGYYSAKEAAIIATGFSTVSATFMIIVAKTLDLMSIWNAYFWLTLVITFVVTAITVRLPPLSKMDNHSEFQEPEGQAGSRLKTAWQEGMEVARKSPPLGQSVVENLKDGLIMTISILPSIMSVGLIGLLVAKYTMAFDIIGYVFYPITWAYNVDQGMLLAKATASGLAEMFLPALLMTEADFVARFSAGVVSVSSVLFFSASIPCILSTKIPLKISTLVWVWFLRAFLSLALAIPVGMLIAP